MHRCPKQYGRHYGLKINIFVRLVDRSSSKLYSVFRFQADVLQLTGGLKGTSPPSPYVSFGKPEDNRRRLSCRACPSACMLRTRGPLVLPHSEV